MMETMNAEGGTMNEQGIAAARLAVGKVLAGYDVMLSTPLVDRIIEAVRGCAPSDSAVVRAAREAIEAFKLGCFVDAGNALRSLDAALSASTPPDAGTCQCVGTRRYTDGTCDKCGNRIVTEEPK